MFNIVKHRCLQRLLRDAHLPNSANNYSPTLKARSAKSSSCRPTFTCTSVTLNSEEWPVWTFFTRTSSHTQAFFTRCHFSVCCLRGSPFLSKKTTRHNKQVSQS